jgi:hypothetical protein
VSDLGERPVIKNLRLVYQVEWHSTDPDVPYVHFGLEQCSIPVDALPDSMAKVIRFLIEKTELEAARLEMQASSDK